MLALCPHCVHIIGPLCPSPWQAEEAVKAQRFSYTTIMRPGLLDRGELSRGPEKLFAKLTSRCVSGDRNWGADGQQCSGLPAESGVGLLCWASTLVRWAAPGAALLCVRARLQMF